MTSGGDLIWTKGFVEAGPLSVEWTADRSVRIVGYMLIKGNSIEVKKDDLMLAVGDSLVLTMYSR